MHENNFEDQVHDKMQQLGFDPSDAVWSGIDKEINKGKKRKPLFWLFFFSGLTLAGTAFYLGTTKNNPNKMTISQPEKLKNPNQSDRPTGQKQDNLQDVKTQMIRKQIEFGMGDISRLKNSHKLIADKSDEERTHSIVSPENVSTVNDANSDKEKTQTNNVQPAADKIVKKKDNITPGKDSAAGIAKANTPKTNTTKKHWLFGVTIDAGLSNANQSIFKPGNIASFTNANAFSLPGTLASYSSPSSGINPGFSYGAGVVVDRYLSERIYISAGLNYHYYSTTMHTGDFMNNSPTSYQNGNTHSYINKYHFTDLPVMVGFQINKSKKTPLTWEAGLSVSYLLSSTTLQFDPYTNLYYQNTALLNNFQLNGITSLKIGMHVHQVDLQLGPQFQYGLTGLFKQNSTAQQAHLFYGGIAITIILSKK